MRHPCLLALAALVAASSVAHADTYYVSSDGDDDAGGSAERPWRTLQRAATHRLGAGDVVVVRPGTYVGFDFRGRGSDGAPIRFVAEDGVTIDRNNPNTPDGINLEGVQYVTIENFTITGAKRAGIRIVDDCRGVVIRNNRVRDNYRWGVFTGFCTDILIEHNELSGSDDEHGVYHSNSGDRPTIRFNHIFGNAANGVHINGDASMGGDGIISNALIEGNIIHDNGQKGGAGINADGLHDSIIRNNLLYRNHASGIALYKIDAAQGPKGNVVAHNTIVMPADKARWALLIRAAAGPNRAFNNILLNHRARKGAITLFPDSRPEHIRSDYNVVTDLFSTDDEASVIDLARWRKHSGSDAHSFTASADALFVDWKADDYRLSASSPALDKGIADDVAPVDIAGNPRPAGGGVDMGAFERCEGSDCKSPRAGPLPQDPVVAGATPAPPASGAQHTPPAKTGCAGCASGTGTGGALAWLAVFVAVLGLRRVRRQATSRATTRP